MAKHTTNSNRFDPYKNFKFRVKWDGRYVAGATRASGLRRKLPGLKKYPNLTLKRGYTRHAGFKQWASLTGARKNLIIEAYDDAGARTSTYKISRCWVSKFQAPALNAKGNDVNIESLTLEHEGIRMMPRNAQAK